MSIARPACRTLSSSLTCLVQSNRITDKEKIEAMGFDTKDVMDTFIATMVCATLSRLDAHVS